MIAHAPPFRCSRPRSTAPVGGLWRRGLIVLMVCLVWDIPLLLVDVPQYLSVQVQIAILALPILLGLARESLFRTKRDPFGLTMLAFVAYTFFVSALSSTFFIPQPLTGWLPGLPFIMPLLMIYVGRLFGISVREAADGLIIAALIGSLFVIADRISPNRHLDIFRHTADYSGAGRRIVIMHNETAIAFVLIFVRLFGRGSALKRLMWLAALLPLTFNLFVAAESRLAIAAALIAVAGYVTFIERGDRRNVLLMLGATMGLLVLPAVLEVYIEHLLAVGISGDNSVYFRNLEIEHFRRYFEQTHGFGFGLMSLSPNKPNILSDALYYDGAMYGASGYPIGLIDIRLYAALYQFGYIGLLFVLYLTSRSAIEFFKVSRIKRYSMARECGALAAVIVAYMVSPLPVNWFTTDNTITLGGILWMMVSRSRLESGLAAADKTRRVPVRRRRAAPRPMWIMS